MTKVLIIGATGVIGRPVTRHLLGSSRGFTVRAMARRPERAAAVLPAGCEIVAGDLRDVSTIESAMAGMDAVYLNLSGPMTRRPPKGFETDLDGTRNVIRAATAAGVKRVVRISAEGVEQAADLWWNADHKVKADQELLESGLDATVLRPTWLMESLPTLMVGPLRIHPMLGRCPLRWLAGDDFGAAVAGAIGDGTWIGEAHVVVGPELVPFADKPDYLYRLLEMTARVFSPLDVAAEAPVGASEMMTIEQYAAYMRETGDRPRK